MLGLVLSVPGKWLFAAVPTDVVVLVYAIALLVVLAYRLFAIMQAAIHARRVKSISLAWFNRWYVYIGLVVFVVVLDSIVDLAPVPSVDAYNSPSGSMSPTLVEGDYYQTRTMAFAGRLPERGEIAIFRPPSEPDMDFVKRVIGLPGDRIQFRQGRLYINDVLIERVELTHEEAGSLPQHDPDGRIYREILTGGASHLISEIGDDGQLDNTPEFVVPADHVFVLGDNRDRSNDSRGSLGFIPLANLHDKPLFIYWSADKSRIGTVPE